MSESTPTHPPDESRHRAIWELIPWVVNGSASDAEAAAVRAHCRACAGCAEELHLQEALHRELAKEDGPQFDVARGWHAVLRDIDIRTEPDTQVEAAVPGTLARTTLRLRQVLMLMAVEVIVLALAGAGLLYGSGLAAPRYKTLGAPTETPRIATIRLVPSRELTVAQLGTILRSMHLQIVEGPNELGAFALAPVDATSDTAAALAGLRAAPGVVLAEPIR